MPFTDENDDPIAHRLNAMPPVEPPGDLRTAVMDAIRSGSAASPIWGGSSRRHRFAIGWAAAAAVILVSVAVFRQPDGADVPATMAPVAARYTSDGVTMLARQTGGDLQLELAADRRITISVRSDPKSAAVVAMTGASDASLQNNLTTFTLENPSQRASLTLRPLGGARSTTLLVQAEGKDVIRADVPLPQPTNFER